MNIGDRAPEVLGKDEQGREVRHIKKYITTMLFAAGRGIDIHQHRKQIQSTINYGK